MDKAVEVIIKGQQEGGGIGEDVERDQRLGGQSVGVGVVIGRCPLSCQCNRKNNY